MRRHFTIALAGALLLAACASGIYHPVRRGETVWRIAQHYGLPHAEVLEANGLSEAEARRLQPGTELWVPGAKAEQIPKRALRPLPFFGGGGVCAARGFQPAWPLKRGGQVRVSSRFGMRWGRRHRGIDIAAPAGTPVLAAAEGRVRFSGPLGNFGLLVVLEHGDGITTLYAHLRRALVRKGAAVKRGARVGEVGATGNATGPNLHFEVRVRGTSVNPLPCLPP